MPDAKHKKGAISHGAVDLAGEHEPGNAMR